jgi:hypothetical protein
MSFSALASYPNGKDMFQQGYEELDSDFFDQFLTFSPIDNASPDYSLLREPASLESSISDSHSGETSSSDEAKHTIVSPRCRGESRALNLESALLISAQGNAFYAELSGRAAISDSGLLSLEGITLNSPQKPAHTHTSLPSSPTQNASIASRRKNRIVQSLSKTFRRAAGISDKSLLRSPIRKANSSPKMNRGSYQYQNFDVWGQNDASKFGYDYEDTMPLSPPSSTRISDASGSSNAQGNVLNAFSYNGLPQQMVGSYNTPVSTPPLNSYQSQTTSYQSIPSSDYQSTPQSQDSSASWSQMPEPSDYNSYNATYEDTYDASTTYQADIDAPVWWNHAAAAPMAQPSPSGYHTDPQRATQTLAMQLQNDAAYDTNDMSFDSSSNMTSGLMIQMPGNPAQTSFVMGTPPIVSQGYLSATNSQPHNNRQYANAPSRQPQMSSPMQKSRSESSESESPSPKLSSVSHVRKRKTQKSNKEKTPRTPNTGGAVDFVNYTPNDSRKILTGVAPSGSSKTKARREKEALEKRRKLSQAAVRAVRAAGGDVDSLVEQGLFA